MCHFLFYIKYKFCKSFFFCLTFLFTCNRDTFDNALKCMKNTEKAYIIIFRFLKTERITFVY